jgi:hypothetical protein
MRHPNTFPMAYDEKFKKVCDLVSRSEGQNPVVKIWKGTRPVMALTSIGTSNNYADLRLTKDSADVSLINMAGEVEHKLNWRLV